MKSNKIGIFAVVAIMIGLTYFLYKSGKIPIIFNQMEDLQFNWLMSAFVSIIFYWVFEAKILKCIVDSMEENLSFWNAFKIAMIGQFFSGVTPFATGGQPAQLLVLNKEKLSIGKSSSALMMKFIFYQGTLIIYCVLLLVFKLSFFLKKSSNLGNFIIIGFIVNIFVIALLLFFSFSKKSNLKTMEKILNCLNRFMLIKNLNEQIERYKKNIMEFHDAIIGLKNNLKLVLQIVIFTLLQLTFYFIVPYFLYRSFGMEGGSLINFIAATAFVLMITSFVPIPGGSGGAEGGFYLIFGMLFLSKYIITALVLWRFMTYYFWILIGGIFTILWGSKFSFE